MSEHECRLPSPISWPLEGFMCPVCEQRWKVIEPTTGAFQWVAVESFLPSPVTEAAVSLIAAHLLANDLRGAPGPLTLVASEREALAQYLIEKGWHQ